MGKLILFVYALLFVCSCGNLAYDIALSQASTALYQCVRHKYQEIAMWTPYYSSINQISRQNFINAKNAGLKVQVQYTPCRTITPEVQVQQFLNKLGQGTIQRVWIYPGNITQPSCYWDKFSPNDNCAFLQNLTMAFKNKGIKIGIAATSIHWTSYFGGRQGCPQVSKQLLAWIPLKQEQNEEPNFDGYKRIGGWEKPYMKLYTSEQVCGRPFLQMYIEDQLTWIPIKIQ